MKKGIKLLASFVMMLSLVLVATPIVVQAAEESFNALSALEDNVSSGIAGGGAGLAGGRDDIDNTKYAFTCIDNTYDLSDGGYVVWEDMFDSTQERTGRIDEAKFDAMTKSARQDFLADVLTICNNIVAYNSVYAKDTDGGDAQFITAETVNAYSKKLQNLKGAGSTLIASLLTETKPDYATANQIYMPFSGVIGTILGLLSILIIALLGVSMGIDIAYITIPAFQMFVGPPSTGAKGKDNGEKSAIGRLVSMEAQAAVQAASNTGDNGQSGSGNKMAIGVYFKHRWKGLVMLGICLLYLIQGQIYSFVAWVLDLVSGFAGF